MSECVVCGGRVVDAGLVCHRCANSLGTRLRDAAEHAAHLPDAIARRMRTGGHGVGDGDALPLRLGVSYAGDAVRGTFGVWAREIATARGFGPPVVARPARPRGPICRDEVRCLHRSCNVIRYPAPARQVTFAAVARWLADQVPWLRHRDNAAQAWDELGDACDLLRRSVDGLGDMVYLGPCGDVDADECAEAIYAPAGADSATCRACAARHDVVERRAWLMQRVAVQVVPAARIAAAVAVDGRHLPGATVRSWIKRGRLVADCHDDNGRPLYRVGDALKLMRRQ